jgi:hypothetical protein
MIDSLASCAHWHPGIPSQIRILHGVGSKGKPFLRRHCRVCRGMYAKQRHNTDTRKLPLAPYGVALGVVRLGWAAPELMA